MKYLLMILINIFFIQEVFTQENILSYLLTKKIGLYSFFKGKRK